MSAITKIYTGAIVLGIIVAGSIRPAHSQSRTADSFNFDELSAGGKGSWDFLSEDETLSIRDDLNNLKEYDISGRRNFDIRVVRENRRHLGIRRWGNQGDRSYYSIGDGFNPYYFRDNRIYDY